MWTGRFEAVTKNPIEQQKREVGTLREHGGDPLALFGSALRDDFDLDKSDLDLCVESPSP